ncbi:protein kinase [Patescibacteria group bacterium]|nr:protein kinase [Patescibacteria group bacterium]
MDSRDNDKTSTHVVLTKGTIVSHYRIIEKIGAGGMGEVYLAEDTKLNRQVALKFLSSQFLSTSDAKTRFVNEARAAAALDHPNICPVYEIDEANGRSFIAMAYINGVSLAEKVKAGPLKLQEVLSLGIDIALGVQEAHEKGIVHRDIKSANVLVTRKGQGKVTDFGLAKIVDASGLTKTGTVMGTAPYMSPEQVRGETVDYRSDIWSLGVVIYEMLTGELPFKGDSGHAVTHQIVHEDAAPITSVRTGVPLEFERIARKCLTKDPSSRYQHVDDLVVDLRSVSLEKVATRSKERKTRFLPLAIVVLAVAVLYFLIKPLFAPISKQVLENPLANATFRKLTDIEGYKDATISPDGKLVAFVSDHDGEFDIWVSQVETGNVYNRTRGQYGDMRRGLQDVGFSSSSSEILTFSTQRSQPLQSMPLLVGPAKTILRDSVIMAFWSPDGSRVVYYTDSPGDPVFVADADGTNRQVILSSEAGMHQHYQRWSSEGKWIYMNRGSEYVFDTDLWRVRPDGNNLEQLTEDQLDVVYPTPISERVVLFIARDEDGDGPWIWAVDVETKITKKVSIGLEKYNSLSASQDGRRLVTSVIKPEANLLDIWSIPILDTIATESEVTQLVLSGQRAQAPRIGGKSLYFLSSTVAGDGLWKHENGQVKEIWDGSKASLTEVPAISPDGKSILISLMRDGKRHLYLINSDGSNLRLLSDSVDVRGTCSFSPDGKWIISSGHDAYLKGLFKISIDNGHHDLIVEGITLNPVWSPKGDLIVYAGKQVSGFSNLEAIRPDGQKVELPEIKVYARGERFRFLPDGSGLVFMKGWFSGLNFWLLDLSTMKTRQLTILAKGPTMRTFDISPDGKTIIFDRMRVKTEIVLIELGDSETGE